MPTNPPLDDIPEEAAFLAADRGADRIEKKVRAAFRDAIREMASEIDPRAFDLAATYRDGAWAEAILLTKGLKDKLETRLYDRKAKADEDPSLVDEAIEIGLLLGLAVLAVELTQEQLADFRDRASQFVAEEIAAQARWIDAETAKAIALAMMLVRTIPAPTEEVAGIIARTFPPEAFRPMIGLNTKQVRSLLSRAKASIYAGVPVAAVKRQMLADASALLEQRAELVARSITERAINLSQQAALERAASLGIIDANRRLRQWVTRSDGLVCSRCLAFHLVTARIDQPFVSRTGEVAWVPDVHAFGRCRMRVVWA